MKRWLVIAMLVLVGLAGSACSRTSPKDAGRLTVEGRAEVATSDGTLRQVTRSRTLKAGEQVRMIDGTATLGLGGGRQLELRRGTVLRLAVQTTATGQSESRGELVSGDVLVLASGDAATIVAGDSTIQVTGTARISRELAVVASVYEGAAGVESAGRSVSVPALRQVTVPAPGLPSRATPISFSPDDTWDQRYLGDAIELGNQLVAKSRGFTAQLSAGEGTTVDFFRRILPPLGGQPLDASLLSPTRPPGETLIGAAITLEGAKGQFADRWASVFAFHDDGAPWGLVARDQGVDRGSLLATVDAAIGRLPGRQLAAPAAPSPSPTATGGAAGSPSPSPPVPVPVPVPTTPGVASAPAPTPGPSTGTASPSPTGPTTPDSTPASPGPELPPKGPLNTGVPVVDDTVRAVVDALTGLLGQL